MTAGAAAPAAADAAPVARDRVPGPVVLVGTGGVRWSDTGSATPALDRLLGTGLIAERPPRVDRVGPASGPGGPATSVSDRELVAHPAAVEASRTTLPDASGVLPTVATVRLARESDGLEPILRLAFAAC